MKKYPILFTLALALSFTAPLTSRAQSVTDCIEQLILDYQKLAGMKSILSQMYSSYQVLSRGYNAVRNVSQGNFSLHQVFLDGLLPVSPAVRRYPRVADIISDQVALFGEYRNAARYFSSSGRFSSDELQYISGVYNKLMDASLKNIDQLSMVMSDTKLRMSDAERLAAIDRIYLDSHSQLSYLRKFNDEAGKTLHIRLKVAAEKQTLNSLYGITQ